MADITGLFSRLSASLRRSSVQGPVSPEEIAARAEAMKLSPELVRTANLKRAERRREMARLEKKRSMRRLGGCTDAEEVKEDAIKRWSGRWRRASVEEAKDGDNRRWSGRLRRSSRMHNRASSPLDGAAVRPSVASMSNSERASCVGTDTSESVVMGQATDDEAARRSEAVPPRRSSSVATIEEESGPGHDRRTSGDRANRARSMSPVRRMIRKSARSSFCAGTTDRWTDGSLEDFPLFGALRRRSRRRTDSSSTEYGLDDDTSILESFSSDNPHLDELHRRSSYADDPTARPPLRFARSLSLGTGDYAATRPPAQGEAAQGPERRGVVLRSAEELRRERAGVRRRSERKKKAWARFAPGVRLRIPVGA